MTCTVGKHLSCTVVLYMYFTESFLHQGQPSGFQYVVQQNHCYSTILYNHVLNVVYTQSTFHWYFDLRYLPHSGWIDRKCRAVGTVAAGPAMASLTRSTIIIMSTFMEEGHV